MSTLYAAKGETVTCENGHPICTVARDLRTDQVRDRTKDFIDWQQPEPAVGEKANNILCVLCASHWFAGGELSPLLHIGNAWRVTYEAEWL